MSLPPLYDRWMTEALGAPVVGEPKSTCLDCPMCADPAKGRPHQLATFNPRTKCCTYTPALRNFHLGFILRDTDPAMARGLSSVQARLDSKMGVTPIGFHWLADYEEAYDQDGQSGFGRELELRCPHYIDEAGGLCGIWRHRNAVCSTWFCRFEEGKQGYEEWMYLKELLEEVEFSLYWWCIEQLDIGSTAYERLQDVENPEVNLNGAVPITEALRQQVWGKWFGREREFFIACSELVEKLSWGEVMEINRRLRGKLEDLTDHREDMTQTRLPPFLKAKKRRVLMKEEGIRWIEGYRRYDPTPLTTPEHHLLSRFKGAFETADLVEELVEELGLSPKQAHLKVRKWLQRSLVKRANIFGSDDGP